MAPIVIPDFFRNSLLVICPSCGLPSFSPLEDMRFFPSAESSGNIYRGEFFVKEIVRNLYETAPEKIA
jgi:hypothetical protein